MNAPRDIDSGLRRPLSMSRSTAVAPQLSPVYPGSNLARVCYSIVVGTNIIINSEVDCRASLEAYRRVRLATGTCSIGGA